MKNKYIDLIRNIGIFTIANFTSRILSFLILPLYTYYLSTEEFGTIDLVSTLIQLAFPFFSLAITDAAMRFGLSAPEKKRKFSPLGFPWWPLEACRCC